MDMLHTAHAWLQSWIQAHLNQIATTFTMALLVVFGDDINAFVKRRLQAYPFILRVSGFLVLCSLGYGLLTVMLVPAIARLLLHFGTRYLTPVTLGAFVVIGLLAERKRYV